MKGHSLIASIFASLALFLSACSPEGLALSAGATAVTATQKEKGFSAAVSDAEIEIEINALMLREHEKIFLGVGTTVEEGRVLLTGQVESLEHRLTAVRLSWEVVGVREVINEIEVSDESSVEDFARDVWISTQLKSKMLLDQEIRSIDYSVETVNQVVYLMGVAQSTAEEARVIAHAKDISHVRRVVSYVRIKDANG